MISGSRERVATTLPPGLAVIASTVTPPMPSPWRTTSLQATEAGSLWLAWSPDLHEVVVVLGVGTEQLDEFLGSRSFRRVLSVSTASAWVRPLHMG